MLKSEKVGVLTCSPSLNTGTSASSYVPAAMGLGAFRTTSLKAQKSARWQAGYHSFSHHLKVCFAANSDVNLKKRVDHSLSNLFSGFTGIREGVYPHMYTHGKD